MVEALMKIEAILGLPEGPILRKLTAYVGWGQNQLCAILYLHKIMLLPKGLPRGMRHFIQERRAISSFLDSLE